MSLLWIFITISISVVNAAETPELLLHEHVDGVKRYKTLNEATKNMEDSTWCGQAVKGRWILYEHLNYEGDQLVVEEGTNGNYEHTKHYSSARPTSLELKLYEKKVNEEGGKDQTIYGATPDFQLISTWLNDEVSSIEALSGTWELFEHPNYQGNRMVVEEGGRQSVLKNDHYSSARPVCSYENHPATSRIKVFEHSSQQGTSKEYFVDTEDLEDMDDEISSIRVYSGIWELYEHNNFAGKRLVAKVGDQIDVKHDYYGSLRPVCERYAPIPAQCTVTSITIHNNENFAKKDDSGTQIVGLLVDSSCQGGENIKGKLAMDRTDSVEESVGVETGDDTEVNWGVTVGVTSSFTTSGVVAQTEMEFSLEASVGGSHTFSKSNSKETTTGYSQSVGFELEYVTPAVAVLFGSVDKYTTDAGSVPTTLHMDCPDGPREKASAITLTSTTYASADYWYLTKKLDQAFCDAHYKEIYTCMQNFKETYSKIFAARENIKAAFEECFNF